MKQPHNSVEAIYFLLVSGNKYYRAAAILLLKELATTMTANGNGDLASRMVQTFRDEDPLKHSRRKRGENVLRP